MHVMPSVFAVGFPKQGTQIGKKMTMADSRRWQGLSVLSQVLPGIKGNAHTAGLVPDRHPKGNQFNQVLTYWTSCLYMTKKRWLA